MTRPEGTELLGFNASIEMAEALEKIRKRRGRGTSKTALLEEAVSQFIEKETNPLSIEVEINRALENPDYVARVAEAVHKYEVENVSKKRRG